MLTKTIKINENTYAQLYALVTKKRTTLYLVNEISNVSFDDIIQDLLKNQKENKKEMKQ